MACCLLSAKPLSEPMEANFVSASVCICICICIWWAVFVFVFVFDQIFTGVFVFVFVFETPRKNVFVFVFVFDKTYLTPALVGGFSKVGATFNDVGRSFNLFMAITRDVWIISSFRIWGYVLHVEHISCVITNCGQHEWVIPSHFSIAF